MGNKIQRIYVGENLVRPKNVQTFDFQNDGQLGWTLSSSQPSYTSYGVTSGQGIYYRGTVSYVKAGLSITPPSSIFDGLNLKTVKLYFYYPSGKYACGVGKSGSYTFRYSEEENYLAYIGFADGLNQMANVGTKNGELTITMNFTSGNVSGDVNGTTYSINSSGADTIMNSRKDGTFILTTTIWEQTNNCYLRKAEITTVG